VVLTIDPSQRAIERLFDRPSGDNEAPDLLPATFAAFLNVNAFQAYRWEGGNTSLPSLSFTGAMRYGGIVFEGDGQFAENQQGGGYEFERNYARLVYDEPSTYRRWYLGDLSIETRGQQGYVQMGGVGVSRQRQRFDPYRSSVLQGNRQLVLQRDSSVRILRNGVLYRELRLDAGSYDFT
jgi:outer membrane usher protein